eukprot:g5890.t2
MILGCIASKSFSCFDLIHELAQQVLPCSKHYSHDWTICPFAHPGEKARRRDPRVFKYAAVECPHTKEGLKCPRGDLCPFGHNIFECWLHPTRYRTQLCNEPVSCKRKVCFFAHSLDELREPTNPQDNPPEGGTGSGVAPRMSLDGLICSTTEYHQPQRQSIDVGSVAQMRTRLEPPPPQPTTTGANQVNVRSLINELQIQQNQQLANSLVASLLSELTTQSELHQHQNSRHEFLQQTNTNYRNSISGGAPLTLQDTQIMPRWSVDGNPLLNQKSLMTNSMLMESSDYHLPQTTQIHTSFPDPRLVPNVFNPETVMSRVSIDNSLLSQQSPIGFHTGLQYARNVQRQSFQTIREAPVRQSDDRSSTGPSSSEHSTDFMKPESFPVSYPLEGEMYCSDPNLDSSLPDPFILF